MPRHHHHHEDEERKLPKQASPKFPPFDPIGKSGSAPKDERPDEPSDKPSEPSTKPIEPATPPENPPGGGPPDWPPGKPKPPTQTNMTLDQAIAYAKANNCNVRRAARPRQELATTDFDAADWEAGYVPQSL